MPRPLEHRQALEMTLRSELNVNLEQHGEALRKAGVTVRLEIFKSCEVSDGKLGRMVSGSQFPA